MVTIDSAFPLGRVVVTRAVDASGIDPLPYLRRHAMGDWGDLSPGDVKLNEDALTGEGRLMSSYTCPESPDGDIWVITEWDRSVTTVLFPSDY